MLWSGGGKVDYGRWRTINGREEIREQRSGPNRNGAPSCTRRKGRMLYGDGEVWEWWMMGDKCGMMH